MQTEVHEYDGGGVRSRGYLGLPDQGGTRPGILVVHEAPGLDAHPKRRVEMLAKLGYVALAADLYGGGIVGEGPQEAFKLMGPLRDNPDLLRRRMRASFDALACMASVDHKRLAAIGYCFGGLSVLELARSGAAAAGVVSFHGLLKTERPAVAGEVKAKILVCTGSADPIVPVE
jgi:dienelactone hydrolase